jgi:hypothetical protein
MTESYTGPKLCDCDRKPSYSASDFSITKMINGVTEKIEGKFFVEWCPNCKHYEVSAIHETPSENIHLDNFI